MKQFAKIRFVAILGIALSALAPAQTPQPAPAAQQHTPQRAQVTFTAGKLFVSANNSSLNQILRDIAHETGMKLTGSVTEERVFGQYGPAAPAKIIAALLDGTGSNILLLEATSTAPAELILTPRRGGPSPPNPNAYQAPPPIPERQDYPSVMPPEEEAPRNSTPEPTDPEPPNAVRTPQQIFEQLQRIRQQQQQQQQ